jgi:hypothetical protein
MELATVQCCHVGMEYGKEFSRHKGCKITAPWLRVV